jgi:hypothetical protein
MRKYGLILHFWKKFHEFSEGRMRVIILNRFFQLFGPKKQTKNEWIWEMGMFTQSGEMTTKQVGEWTE